MGSKLRMVSWILLTLVGAATLFGSLASVSVAYFSPQDDIIGGVALAEVAGERENVATALQARRGTAASFATGYALLFLLITLVPYRKGEVWAWWAILIVTIAVNGLILLRNPVLGTTLGLGAATIPLAVCIVALLLDAGRIKSSG